MTSKSTPVKQVDDKSAPLLSGRGTTPRSIAPTKSDPATHVSLAKGVLPTLDDVERVAGKALSEEELQKMQASGALPGGINVAMNPELHKVKAGDEEFLVVMIDAPPCGCRRVDGKKERSRLHRAQKRTKKRTKSKKPRTMESRSIKDGQVRDDDSDRKKLVALRHAEDSEDEADQKFEGAFTPDKICAVGPGGIGFLVEIDTTDNANAAPKAAADLKDPIKGILIKGPQDCPQFIPEDKIPKDANGEPKFEKYQTRVLVRKEKGKRLLPGWRMQERRKGRSDQQSGCGS